jgi:ADP-heptose:LPS heptosyltransferase
MVTPIVQELIRFNPNCKIDIVVKGKMAQQVFKEFPQVNQLIELPRKPAKELFKYLKVYFNASRTNYDLCINMDAGSSSGTVITYLSNSKYKLYRTYPEQCIENMPDDFRHMALTSVYTFRYFIKTFFNREVAINAVPSISLNLTTTEKENALQLLHELIAFEDRPILSIFTYATGGKIYSKEWWKVFCDQLDEKLGDRFAIVEVLPFENVSQVDFRYPAFYSTEIREIAAFISHTSLFIAADSGIMHLGCASHIPVIGLFAATREYMYRPYGHESRSVNTDELTIDNIIDQITNYLKTKKTPIE